MGGRQGFVRAVLALATWAAGCGDDGGDGDDDMADPPEVTITSPEQDEIGGPDGLTLEFSTSDGATVVGCALDGAAIDDCASGSTLDGGDGGHTVEVTVAGPDGRTASASVQFVIDATAPLVTQLTATSPTTGTVTFSFTVTDVSAVPSIECRVDGEPFAACGTGTSGTSSATELLLGAHTFEVYATDEWGNTGLGTAQVELPAPHALYELTQANGPGHLVLIGDDLDLGSPEIIATGGIPIGLNSGRLLLNAIGQSAAVDFARGPRIGLIESNSTAGEEFTVRDIIALEVPGATVLEVDTQTELRLDGLDVLIVLDQNGALSGGIGEQVAELIRPTLQTFLDLGGVVIVTDGLVEGAPSETYRLIHPSLLAIDAVTIRGGADMTIPCNVADPLIANEGPLARYEPPLAFVGPEPWVVFGDASEFPPEVGVYHRWFGSTSEGPIAVSTTVTPFPPDTFVFQSPDHTLVAECPSFGGTAVRHMTSSGNVTSIAAGIPTVLFSVLGAEPLDHLHQGGVVAPPRTPDGSLDVELQPFPDFAAGDVMRARTGCDERVTASNGGALGAMAACVNTDGTYSIVAEVVDDAGVVRAFSILNGVTELDGSTVVMPDWLEPNLAVTATPELPFDGHRLTLGLSVGAFDYLQGTIDESRDDETPYTRYSAAGVGTPALDRMLTDFTVLFTSTGNLVGRARRIERQPRPNSLTFDATDTLPRISDPVVQQNATTGQVTVRFGAPSTGLEAIDGGQLVLTWTDHLWFAVFPPGQSVALPVQPGPAQDGQWPAIDDIVGLSSLTLDEATYVDGYRAYRERGGTVLPVPRIVDFVARSISLLRAPD